MKQVEEHKGLILHNRLINILDNIMHTKRKPKKMKNSKPDQIKLSKQDSVISYKS